MQLLAEVDAAVRDAGRQAEAVGTLKTSRPDIGSMFEDIFAQPDSRLLQQRRDIGL